MDVQLTAENEDRYWKSPSDYRPALRVDRE